MELAIAPAASRLRARARAVVKTVFALVRQRRNRSPFHHLPNHRRGTLRDARRCRSSRIRMPEKAGVSAAQIVNCTWLPWLAGLDTNLHRLRGRGSLAGIES